MKRVIHTIYDTIDIRGHSGKPIREELEPLVKDVIGHNLIKSYVKLDNQDKGTYTITFVNGLKLHLSYADTYKCTCVLRNIHERITHICYCVIIKKANITSKLSTPERRILEDIYGVTQQGENAVIPLYFIPISTPSQIDKFNKAYSFNAKSKLLHTGEIAYLENERNDALLYFLNENTTHAIIPSYVEFGLSMYINSEALDISYEVTKLTTKTNRIIHVNSDFNNLVELDIQGNIFDDSKKLNLMDDYYAYSTKIQKLTISNQTESLPDLAFQGLWALTQLKLPSSLKIIGNRTFERCYNLSQIEFPKTLKVIGDRAFEGCNRLRHVKIPVQTQLGIDAFDPYVKIERV